VKRRAVITILVLVAAIACSSVLYFRYFRYAPFPARLLPDEAEAYIYVDLRPVRRVTTINAGSVLQDPEIAKFADETSIVPERDIDEFAMAVLPGPISASGQQERRFAEAITGRFDARKLEAFLRARGQVAPYRNYDVFEVQREDRTVRAVIIGPETVLVTNSASPDTIRSMVDQQRAGFRRAGPGRVNQNFRKVPLGSIAWSIVRLQASESYRPLGLPIGITLPRGADLIVSARALSSLELRAETDTTREDSAKKLANEIATYLTLFRAVQVSVGTGGADPDAKKFFDSIHVQRDGSKVVLTAEVPFGFLRKMASQGSGTVTSIEDPSRGRNKLHK
jgi:hypothetical protein